MRGGEASPEHHCDPHMYMWGRGRARDNPVMPGVRPGYFHTYLYLVHRAAMRPKRPVMPRVRRTRAHAKTVMPQ